MFNSYDNSGFTAFKTVEALSKMIPKWSCLKCGENYLDEELVCSICKFERPDPNNIIAIRMLMDKEEKFEEYTQLDMQPEMFDRLLLGIKKFAEKHDLVETLRESTRKAIEGLPNED